MQPTLPRVHLLSGLSFDLARFEKAKLARQSKPWYFRKGKYLETIKIFPAGKNSCRAPAEVS